MGACYVEKEGLSTRIQSATCLAPHYRPGAQRGSQARSIVLAVAADSNAPSPGDRKAPSQVGVGSVKRVQLS